MLRTEERGIKNNPIVPLEGNYLFLVKLNSETKSKSMSTTYLRILYAGPHLAHRIIIQLIFSSYAKIVDMRNSCWELFQNWGFIILHCFTPTCFKIPYILQ